MEGGRVVETQISAEPVQNSGLRHCELTVCREWKREIDNYAKSSVRNVVFPPARAQAALVFESWRKQVVGSVSDCQPYLIAAQSLE